MTANAPALDELLVAIRACTACTAELPLGPRPVLRAASSARVLIVGQAPGTRVHATGIPWNDPSGDRLRDWMAVDRETFYDERRFAIVPMGLCYPGRGKSGDLPPRPECAALWFEPLLALLPNIRLTLLLGQYAQAYYLGKSRTRPGARTQRTHAVPQAKDTLTATVAAWREYLPAFLPLPHPSPRNRLWLKRNSWFERETVPALRGELARALGGGSAPSTARRRS
ncbi:MAG: uracil-DNA glycosylase family protein [Planctomycetota bacterium]